MKLLVRHQTVYSYDPSAGRVVMRLKLMPVDTPAQTVLDWKVSVNDAPVTGFHRNSNGEMEALWVRHDQLGQAVIVAEGLVETRETHGVVGGPASRVNPLYFLRDTALTRASDAIAAMALALPDGSSPLARLHALAAAVTDAVTYRAGVTTSATTATQAFQLGAGVCQDHAQIFIAGARVLGIPARY
ncbi:MAG: transglutaminase family protein, partial [Sphingobium sp.]|nr:transglutaminase family protein [Sphingobium sp.]